MNHEEEEMSLLVIHVALMPSQQNEAGHFPLVLLALYPKCEVQCLHGWPQPSTVFNCNQSDLKQD